VAFQIQVLTKILFHPNPDDWHGRVSETLWGELLSDRDVLAIQNSPFFAHGVSFLDVVCAVRHPEQGNLELPSALSPGVSLHDVGGSPRAGRPSGISDSR
jgi:hypothetical protein